MRAVLLDSYNGTDASKNQLDQARIRPAAKAAASEPRERSDSSARNEREKGLDMRHLYNLLSRLTPKERRESKLAARGEE